MTLASRLSRGVLEALEDPSLPLELLAGAPWWPLAAAVCADKARAEVITGLVRRVPAGSTAARLVEEMSWANEPEPLLQRARHRLDQARELVALGPRDCDLALRALAILDRLVP